MNAYTRMTSPSVHTRWSKKGEKGWTHVTHGSRRLAALERVRASLLVLAAAPADLSGIMKTNVDQ